MAKQLHTAKKICAVANIWNFIKLLGEEVEDSVKDFIKYVVELYTGPDCNIETEEEVID